MFNEFLLDEENSSYLISQNEAIESFDGKITSREDYELYFLETTESKLQLSSNNTSLKLLVVNKDSYDVKDIYITTLPLLEINSRDRLLTVHNSSQNNGIKTDSYKMTYKVRGSSSKAFPKKNFKVELNNEESLLGMRKDDDWILNAMALDWSYMREIIAFDMWNAISIKNNHTLKLIELVIDGKYHGLYYLQEPVDSNTYNFDEEKDFFYSIKNYVREEITENTPIEKYDGESIVHSFELERITHETQDEYMRVLSSVNESFYNRNGICEIVYDDETFLKYNILVNILKAHDNLYKNTKFAVQKQHDEYYITKTPWDLDMIWGCEEAPLAFVNWSNSPDAILEDGARNIDYFNTSEMKDKEKELYVALRENILTDKYFEEKIAYYYAKLMDSGAISRNNERWNQDGFPDPYGESNVSGEARALKGTQEAFEYGVTSLKEFLFMRLEVLDAYYEVSNGI